MVNKIKQQSYWFLVFYAAFAIIGMILMVYYLSNTLLHFTSPQQFPINSFHRFPLSFIIFPAELFSFAFSLYFVYNLINGNTKTVEPERLKNKESTRVAILVPVYNEPKDIVARTLHACKNIQWAGGIKIYLLDDSTNKTDQENMLELSKSFNATLVRRDNHTGFKAGNINNAIKKHVKEEYFAIFDSDQAPEPEFLGQTMDYFSDLKVGFVQTPQYFINTHSLLERAQALGTNIFYQAQCQSKAKDHAMPFCGTNVVVRTSTFKEVNGFSYFTSTEDIELGLRMNEAGYYGAYVPAVLVKGYATNNFQAYRSQQYRWANGNLAILRESWKRILFGSLSFRQQVHSMFTMGWWVVGVVIMLYILVPILSFFFYGTHHTWLPSWMLGILFLNVALGISMIYASLSKRDDKDKVTISDAFIQYSLITNSLFIYAQATFNAIFKRYIGFVRTNKENQKTGLKEVRWNLTLAAVCFSFSVFALYKSATAGSVETLRTYLPLSLWLLFYTVILASSILFVGAAPVPSTSAVPSVNSAYSISSDNISNQKTFRGKTKKYILNGRQNERA